MVHLLASEVQQLLHNKFVVILGDSVQRAVYKDLVLLLQKDCLLTYKQLSAKGELTFEKDHLVEGGQLDELHNGTHYREVREFCSDHHLVRFYFLTRVYSPYLQNILQELWSDNEQGPDVVIMNSCLWDISRYGPNSWRSYRKNLENLFGCLGQMLPKSCLLVWNTAMPLGDRIKARFLPKKGEYRPTITTLKKNLLRANFYSCVEARKHFFDVLDLHFHFRHARMHLQGDGVHWNEHAHRQLSQLLLAHVADAWGVELPCRDPVVSYSEYDPADAEWEGGEWEESGQVEDLYPPSKGGLQGVGQCLPQPPHNPLHLRPSLRPPPLLPLPPPLHHVRHPPPPYAQDNYFTSDHTFQSDQFYIHSDAPPPTHTGYAFKGDFRFGSQPPMPNFHPHCYQRRAPVVHRGYPRYLAPGPYVSWRGRPRRSQRSTPASLESRPQ